MIPVCGDYGYIVIDLPCPHGISRVRSFILRVRNKSPRILKSFDHAKMLTYCRDQTRVHMTSMSLPLTGCGGSVLGDQGGEDKHH